VYLFLFNPKELIKYSSTVLSYQKIARVDSVTCIEHCTVTLQVAICSVYVVLEYSSIPYGGGLRYTVDRIRDSCDNDSQLEMLLYCT
jgi:hypothetical protein